MRRQFVEALVVTAVLAMSAGCDASDLQNASPESEVSSGATRTPAPPISTSPTSPSTAHSTTHGPSSTTSPAPRYVFPVAPAVAASYGRTHHDYPATDIFAACGTSVVAVTDGVVEEISRIVEWDPATDDPALRGGLSVSVVGADGVRYYVSHLRDVAPGLTTGSPVEAGEVIAHVGDTGNAVGSGCHVHFGLSPDCGPGDWAVRRGILYPWPYLDAWRTGDQASPADEVAAWLEDQPGLCR